MKINRLSDEEVKHHLVDQMQVPELQASRIAYLSEGNIQMALQLSKEDNGNAFGDFTAWLRNSFANNMIALIDFSDAAAKWGRENQKNFLRYGTKLLREVMMELSGADNLIHLPPNEKEFVVKFSKSATLAQTEALINEVEKAHYHIERNANAKILFLDVSLQFTRILKFKTLPKGTHYIYQ